MQYKEKNFSLYYEFIDDKYYYSAFYRDIIMT